MTCIFIFVSVQKVDEFPVVDTADSLFLSLVQPRLCLTRKCTINITNLVEYALSEETSAEESKKVKDMLLKFHTIPMKYPRTVFVCTESRSKDHIEHQEFSVQIVNNCSLSPTPLFRKESQIIVFTSDRSVELYSIVCPALSCEGKQSLQNTCQEKKRKYICQCSVTVVLDVEGAEEIKYEAKLNQTVMFNTDFEIHLQIDRRKVTLQPNQKYWVKVHFSDVHPLYLANDTEHEAQDKRYVKVQCGEVIGERGNCGSHIKCILYRIL